jgi:hypothetical protein
VPKVSSNIDVASRQVDQVAFFPCWEHVTYRASGHGIKSMQAFGTACFVHNRLLLLQLLADRFVDHDMAIEVTPVTASKHPTVSLQSSMTSIWKHSLGAVEKSVLLGSLF